MAACRWVLLVLLALVTAPTDATTKVVCVGDSITEGNIDQSNQSPDADWRSSPAGRPSSWPAQLQQLLGSEFEVTNLGLGGRAATHTSDVPYWEEEKYHQNLLHGNWDIGIVMLGTNDTKVEGSGYSKWWIMIVLWVVVMGLMSWRAVQKRRADREALMEEITEPRGIAHTELEAISDASPTSKQDESEMIDSICSADLAEEDSLRLRASHPDHQQRCWGVSRWWVVWGCVAGWVTLLTIIGAVLLHRNWGFHTRNWDNSCELSGERAMECEFARDYKEFIKVVMSRVQNASHNVYVLIPPPTMSANSRWSAHADNFVLPVNAVYEDVGLTCVWCSGASSPNRCRSRYIMQVSSTMTAEFWQV